MKDKIQIQDALEYEIFGSWWSGFIGNERLQKWAADYYCWKANRKYKRYQKRKEFQAKLKFHETVQRTITNNN